MKGRCGCGTRPMWQNIASEMGLLNGLWKLFQSTPCQTVPKTLAFTARKRTISNLFLVQHFQTLANVTITPKHILHLSQSMVGEVLLVLCISSPFYITILHHNIMISHSLQVVFTVFTEISWGISNLRRPLVFPERMIRRPLAPFGMKRLRSGPPRGSRCCPSRRRRPKSGAEDVFLSDFMVISWDDIW